MTFFVCCKNAWYTPSCSFFTRHKRGNVVEGEARLLRSFAATMMFILCDNKTFLMQKKKRQTIFKIFRMILFSIQLNSAITNLLSLYCLNTDGYIKLTDKSNKYWQSRDVSYNRIWLYFQLLFLYPLLRCGC